MDPKYLVVEGPIGVGKTSLVTLLAEQLAGKAILEESENNPFLLRFYRDRWRWAFQTQLFFLLSRYRQQEEMAQHELFSNVTITDVFLPKDRIFASLNLSPDELVLYDQVYGLLRGRLPKPDLVIYLHAETDVLMQRVHQRGREYEKELTWEYLDALNRAYNEFFFGYTDTPLLVLQTTEIDFVNNAADLAELIRQIRHMKGGVQYYVPAR
ncbi:MAG: deoxynucleoside kinase [Nitrospirota bacterium]